MEERPQTLARTRLTIIQPYCSVWPLVTEKGANGFLLLKTNHPSLTTSGHLFPSSSFSLSNPLSTSLWLFFTPECVWFQLFAIAAAATAASADTVPPELAAIGESSTVLNVTYSVHYQNLASSLAISSTQLVCKKNLQVSIVCLFKTD